MNNFIGEFLTIRGAFEAKVVWGALAALGSFWARTCCGSIKRVFFGR
jgi:NADH:ubiquinone oxidoreductase subunit 4 (subunit M)